MRNTSFQIFLKKITNLYLLSAQSVFCAFVYSFNIPFVIWLIRQDVASTFSNKLFFGLLTSILYYKFITIKTGIRQA